MPEVWPTGSVSGLRAKGGFEIVDMQWKEAKLVKVVIRSTLGGNLRLRVPNALRLTKGALVNASGKNTNPFYRVEEISVPIVSPKATIELPKLKDTILYDMPTTLGKVYVLIAP